jgi:nitrogen fixation protein NifU and related proteins
LDDLYREVILEHYKSPRNRGRLPEPDVATRGHNPLCGDDVEISLDVDAGAVQDIRFLGRGCSISQASASMLTEAVKGKSLAEARQLVAGFKAMMRGETPTDVDLRDIEALQGVRNVPVRIKCAMLAWTTLEEALDLAERGNRTKGMPSP